MYYSVENGDRGEVRLNGSIIPHVIACDTEKGWVECAVQPLTVADGKLITQVLKGDVEVIRYV